MLAARMLCFVAAASVPKFSPGACTAPITVRSNFIASAPGRRATILSYSAARSRRNSVEKGRITAILWPFMIFMATPGFFTGFAAVSSTHSASGSAVMVGMLRPRPGRGMRRASCMMADSPRASCMTSWLTSVGRSTAVLLVWMPVGINQNSFQILSAAHPAKLSRVVPAFGAVTSPPSFSAG